MRRVTIGLVVLGVLALAFISMPMRAQNQTYPFPGFPPEFSPLVTSRPAKPQRSLVPSTKFVKVGKAIPNRYIVVLNDDVVSSDAPLQARRAAVTAIANSHALAYLGKVGYLYETALKGYSIELPNEAAAIALSENPQVKWVEEDGILQLGQAPASPQSTPPWGLDAIDGTIPAPTPDINGRTNGLYIFNGDGSGVNAYVLDTGINTQHQDFFTGFNYRAHEAADCIQYANCQSGALSPWYNWDTCGTGMPNANNNDCDGHGTHVAGIVGGNTYGVAKNVTINSVKVCFRGGCVDSAIIQGVNWVTSTHNANPTVPAVVNMSLWGDNRTPYNPPYANPTGVDSAVSASINFGVTYCVIAGNANDDVQHYYPADVSNALTVGSVDWTGTRASDSNWGTGVDLFAPGVYVVSAQSGNGLCSYWDGSNTSTCIASGTSQASPHVAGAVAIYLQGRTGTSSCNLYPIQSPASTIGGPISTCPDRVARFVNANSNLSKLSNLNGSANRFLWTSAVPMPTTANPIKNQRFFVWQHYADFNPAGGPVPNESGLNFWTSQITTPPVGCNTGFNYNNDCTDGKRVDVSRAFWVSVYPSWFNGSYGLTNFNPSLPTPCAGSAAPTSATPNERFLDETYCVYLRRRPQHDDSGFMFWKGVLDGYGSPASPDGVNRIIRAFIIDSTEYRQRFGQP